MKHRLRGAAHRALIVALAFVFGVSSIALAAQAQTPTETGAWIGNACKENPGQGRDFDGCIWAKCDAIWGDQQNGIPRGECYIRAQREDPDPNHP